MTGSGGVDRYRQRATGLAAAAGRQARRLVGVVGVLAAAAIGVGVLLTICVGDVTGWNVPAVAVAFLLLAVPPLLLWWYRRRLLGLVELPGLVASTTSDYVSDARSRAGDTRASLQDPAAPSSRVPRFLRRGPLLAWALVVELWELRRLLGFARGQRTELLALVNPAVHIVGGVAVLVVVALAALLPFVAAAAWLL